MFVGFCVIGFWGLLLLFVSNALQKFAIVVVVRGSARGGGGGRALRYYCVSRVVSLSLVCLDYNSL